MSESDVEEEALVLFLGGPWDGAREVLPIGPEPPGAWVVVDGCEQRAIYEPTDPNDVTTWHFFGWIAA